MRRILLAVTLFSGLSLSAQQLDAAKPHHYILKITPDFKAGIFKGEVTIHGDTLRPTSEITLHAVELEFREVTLQALPAGEIQTASVKLDKKKQTATLGATVPLPAGPVEIKIKYRGKLGKNARGFYRASCGDSQFATTALAGGNARRMFPSWDDPAYPAPFNVLAVVGASETARSNAAIEKEMPSTNPEERVIAFAMTEKIPTSDLRLSIGEARCLPPPEAGATAAR